MDQLTSRQQQTLEIITRFIGETGYPPSLRQIGAQLGVSGNAAILKHLDALEQKGHIRRQGGSSRGITLASASAPAAVAELPVVGSVRAGLPQPAIEDIEGYFAIDQAHRQRSGGTFFLRVKGDSMINACIKDGDLALVRPQQTADNRDLVVAMVNGEATLKRFYREHDAVRLQPENPNYEPIMVRPGQELNIVGKVVGLFRQHV